MALGPQKILETIKKEEEARKKAETEDRKQALQNVKAVADCAEKLLDRKINSDNTKKAVTIIAFAPANMI